MRVNGVRMSWAILSQTPLTSCMRCSISSSMSLTTEASRSISPPARPVGRRCVKSPFMIIRALRVMPSMRRIEPAPTKAAPNNPKTAVTTAPSNMAFASNSLNSCCSATPWAISNCSPFARRLTTPRNGRRRSPTRALKSNGVVAAAALGGRGMSLPASSFPFWSNSAKERSRLRPFARRATSLVRMTSGGTSCSPDTSRSSHSSVLCAMKSEVCQATKTNRLVAAILNKTRNVSANRKLVVRRRSNSRIEHIS